jgi:predicted O-methyltransferase YrrM
MSDKQLALMEALRARGVVREWVEGARTLAILAAVHRMGWLEQLRRPTPEQALTSENWSPDRVRGVLDALAQAGVVADVFGGWQLTPLFAILLNGASGVSLDNVLALARLDLDALERLDQGQPTAVDGEAALIVAMNWGVDASSDTRVLYRLVYQALPEVTAALQSGGPMLDLGSGVGGALLTTAQLYPQLKLVGVDFVPEVTAETRLRRDKLGLTDQVEVRTLDARDLPEQGHFRVAYWAQAFFPDTSRAATLAVLRRALTDDGLLVLQEQPSTPTDVVQQAQRGISAERSPDELAREAEDAGFVLVRQVTTAVGNLTLLRNQP